MPPKKQAQMKRSHWVLEQSLTTSSTFITLKLGRSAYERLLRRANPETLKWIKTNTLLWTQARTIAQRYLKDESTKPANVADVSSRATNDDGGRLGRVLRVSTTTLSAASHAEPADDGDKQNDGNNEVSTVSSAFLFLSDGQETRSYHISMSL